MKIPLSWLKDFVDIDIKPEILADKLTNIGFEIEELKYLGKDIENVFTGKITAIVPHPNADSLVICTLNMNDKILTIVTGAKNVKVGDIVPVAIDGAILPCGKKIKNATLRGVTSQGMLCSGEELCVDNSVIDGAEIDGIMILPSDTMLGIDIKKILELDDYVFDISITPNRADCNSVWGIAREVGAVLGKNVKQPSLKYTANKIKSGNLSVNIKNYELCSRYMAAIVDNITIKQSPKWIQRRLGKVGIRAINNMADITNYVLTEIGQPMHAFDYNNIADNTINVRTAQKNEKITALDGKEYKLFEDMLVIADSKRPIAIAGVMGGEYSSISSDTFKVVFESAKFSRATIRSTSRKLGLSSASSARYIRGVDYWSIETGLQRALSLINELKMGDIIEPIIDIKNEEIKEKEITVSIKRINNLLGLKLSAQQIFKVLKPLEIKATANGDNLCCIIPIFREDIENYADIAEEIIRYYGYDNIGISLPYTGQNIKIGTNNFYKAVDKTKQTLTGMGMFEALSYSFISKKSLYNINLSEGDFRLQAIEIINPLSEEFKVMRTTLIPNMLNIAYNNLTHKNNEFRIFEISRVYLPKKLPMTELPDEVNVLGSVICGKNENFFTLKLIAENILDDFGITAKYIQSKEPFLHDGISADIIVNNDKIGFLGCLHPLISQKYELDKQVYVMELNYDKLRVYEKVIIFKPLPKYQVIERDLAFSIKDEFSAQEITDYIKHSGGENLLSVELFDVYKGSQIEEGYKSMAFSLEFYSDQIILKDEDIAKYMQKIIRGLSYKYNASLRS